MGSILEAGKIAGNCYWAEIMIRGAQVGSKSEAKRASYKNPYWAEILMANFSFSGRCWMTSQHLPENEHLAIKISAQ